MADPLWFGPPEAVAALLETSNPATIVANIAAWLAEAIQHELSMGVSVANIGATLTQWLGLGGAAYGVKGTELNLLGLQPLAAHCLKHVSIGQAALEANTIARSAVIPAVVCQTNRDETAALYASNVCGCNTPAIVANETEYFGYFTPQNTSIGLAYASTLNALIGAIASTPPPITPMGASPAAAVGPAESVAESAADTGMSTGPAEAVQAAGQAASPASGLSQLMTPLQAMTSLPNTLKPVTDLPTQVFSSASQSFSGPLQNIMGMFPSLLSQQGVGAAAGVPVEAVAGPLGGGVAGGVGAATGGGTGAVGVGYSGLGLTKFTQPAGDFSAEPVGGRATTLRGAGLLSAADVRSPTAPVGGTPMPMSPAGAGMLARDGATGDRDKVPHARIVVHGAGAGQNV